MVARIRYPAKRRSVNVKKADKETPKEKKKPDKVVKYRATDTLRTFSLMIKQARYNREHFVFQH